MEALILENLCKTFRGSGGSEIQALDGLNLRVRKGERLAVLGPSGSGKTTLIRCIAGLENPDQGRIHMEGSEITLSPPDQRNVAIVFQNTALYPHLNVFENLAFGLRLRKKAKSEIRRMVEDAAVTMRLQGLLQRPITELSGGQQQRVAIGRTMVLKPDVFLLDEPFSNLDPDLRTHLHSEIIQIQQQLGKTMILVTHDQNEAMAFGDRITLMKVGKCLQIGTPRELYQVPEHLFVGQFIGRPKMNLIEGILQVCSSKLVFKISGSEGRSLELPSVPGLLIKDAARKGVEVCLGIRPEALQVLPCDVPSSDSLPASMIPVSVEKIEFFGAESCLYLNSPFGNLVAKCAEPLKLTTGQNAVVRFSGSSGIHFFNPTDGENLLTGGSEENQA